VNAAGPLALVTLSVPVALDGQPAGALSTMLAGEKVSCAGPAGWVTVSVTGTVATELRNGEVIVTVPW